MIWRQVLTEQRRVQEAGRAGAMCQYICSFGQARHRLRLHCGTYAALVRLGTDYVCIAGVGGQIVSA